MNTLYAAARRMTTPSGWAVMFVALLAAVAGMAVAGYGDGPLLAAGSFFACALAALGVRCVIGRRRGAVGERGVAPSRAGRALGRVAVPLWGSAAVVLFTPLLLAATLTAASLMPREALFALWGFSAGLLAARYRIRSAGALPPWLWSDRCEWIPSPKSRPGR